jgi:ABC-type protease/lipase transport system fused ATPase/permease subunit
MRQLRHILSRPILHICVMSIGVNLLLLAPSLFMMQVFDRVLVSQSLETLLALALGVLIALLLLFALDHLRSRLQGVVGNLIGDALLPEVVRATVERSASAPGRAANDVLRDVAALRQLCSAQGLLAVLDAPWLIIYVALIAWIHPLLGLTAAVAAAAMLFLALLNDLLTRRNILAVQHTAASATNYLDQSLRRVEVLQALGMTNAMLRRWAERNAKVSELQRATAVRSVAMAVTARVVRQAAQVAMLARRGS